MYRQQFILAVALIASVPTIMAAHFLLDAPNTPRLFLAETSAASVQTPSAANVSHAYGVWTPSKWDTCSKALHDSYAAIGPDGKTYPTWHPPTAMENGQPCTFGHEHGRDPNGSALLPLIQEELGGVLFGYANEKLDEWNAAQGIQNGMRHEDHVGHKIEWENNVRMAESINVASSPRRYVDVYCDFLMKVHQGTHSPDALTNNVHELLYAAQCRDAQGGSVGTRVLLTKMVVFGEPGGFSEGSPGGFTFVPVGPADPVSSPSGNGVRSIPTINTVNQYILVPAGQWSLFSNGLYEDWISSNYVFSRDGQQIAYYDPHFAVFEPSRFYDPSAPNKARPSIEVCYMSENGGAERARGGTCDAMGPLDPNNPIPYDDPRSLFNGVKREFYFNQTTLQNAGGSTTWYTNPYGGDGVTQPFAGAIKQYIAAVTNTHRNEAGFIDPAGRAYAFESVAVGADRAYGGNGVHAPN